MKQIFIGGITAILYLLSKLGPSAFTVSKKRDIYKRWCCATIYFYHNICKRVACQTWSIESDSNGNGQISQNRWKRFQSKNARADFHFLLQGILPTQGSNLHLLYWQVDSLLLSYQGSPCSWWAAIKHEDECGYICVLRKGRYPQFLICCIWLELFPSSSHTARRSLMCWPRLADSLHGCDCRHLLLLMARREALVC